LIDQVEESKSPTQRGFVLKEKMAMMSTLVKVKGGEWRVEDVEAQEVELEFYI
jgi:hypothetical protein